MLKLTYIALILNLVLSFSLLSDQSCKVFRNITAEALQQEEEFRQQTKWELYGLCANIKDLSQNLSSEISLENLKNHILDKIEHDELLLAEMMVVSQNMPDRTWSFKTNKNLLLLAGAKELIENGFEDLLGCKLGETQKYDFEKITWLGDGNNNVYSLIEAAVKFDFD